MSGLRQFFQQQLCPVPSLLSLPPFMCREPVTAVTWHSSTADGPGPMMGSHEEADMLISLASDGRLLLWRWQTAELLYGCVGI